MFPSQVQILSRTFERLPKWLNGDGSKPSDYCPTLVRIQHRSLVHDHTLEREETRDITQMQHKQTEPVGNDVG
jgi:hypothetical protein